MELVIFLALIFVGASTGLPPAPKQYRDYEYNRKTDAFYKLHIEDQNFRAAQEICTMEGAQLMVPSTKEDITQLHGMLKKFPDIGDFVFVAPDGKDHESAEETPIIDLSNTNTDTDPNYRWSSRPECEVVTRNGDIEMGQCYSRHPFICKVDAKDAVYDRKCGVYAKDYKYYEAVHSCYKVPTPMPLNWEGAYAECQRQGAHLAVINSEAESAVIKEFLATAPRIVNAKTSYFYYAGIRANKPPDPSQRVFRTIFNETLEEAGFNGWSDGEPNNHLQNEYCGTIFMNNGKYNDVDCLETYGFICEKEVTQTPEVI